MKQFTVTLILTAGFVALLLLFAPVKAGSAVNSNSIINSDFDFTEHRKVLIEMAEVEEHPHFLEENAQRYTDYQTENPDMPFDLVIAHVNAYLDKEQYEDIQNITNPDSITVLVNKIFMLESDWEPSDFVDIGGGHMMRGEAAEYFIKMREAMREDGLNLNIVIVYRSYNSQRNHFRNAVSRLGLASAEAGFARPGHSEHQTGLAVDVLHKAHDGGLMMHQGFDDSRQYRWLVENAYEYGFILRYPRNYRNLSGFIYEPWHWRFVGVDVATAMKEEEIALFEEFYGRYLAQGIIDKVNAFVIEQQALAEAAELAAIAEAEAAAAEAAALAEAEAAEAAARAAEEAAAAAEAAALEAARVAAENAAREAAEKAAAEEAARIHEATNANRHFIELFSIIGITSALGIANVAKKRSK